jgi:hypothetical protein
MTFTIRQFYAESLGNVSVMAAKGFFGLMQMDTFIVNPVEKDLPLFSYDRIHAMGNDTLILELYDTLLGEGNLGKIQAVNKKFNALPQDSFPASLQINAQISPMTHIPTDFNTTETKFSSSCPINCNF